MTLEVQEKPGKSTNALDVGSFHQQKYLIPSSVIIDALNSPTAHRLKKKQLHQILARAGARLLNVWCQANNKNHQRRAWEASNPQVRKT